MQKHLLIVSNDPDASEGLASQLLLHEGMTSNLTTTAHELVELIRNTYFDAVIIDIDSMDIKGADLCRIIRRNDFVNPIMVVTAPDSEAEQILTLDAGANDVITRPIGFGIFLARLRAALRHNEVTGGSIFRIGMFTFSPSAKLLIDSAGRHIRLTEIETRLLKYLYRKRGEAASQERLLNDVWGYKSKMDTHTVETHVYRLRKKVDQGNDQLPLIITDAHGYRLAGIDRSPRVAEIAGQCATLPVS